MSVVPGAEVLTVVSRAGRRESVHRGSIAVVDAGGRLLAYAGDPGASTYFRSSAKPFQALAAVESGAADRFGLTPRELAVMAASHAGEPRHVDAVSSILEKIGLREAALLCGAHPPFSPESQKRLEAERKPPGAIHNNCSGKHAGMLAAAADQGWSLDDYLDPQHSVQRAILGAVAELAGLAEPEIGLGVDGCSAPTFYLPLRTMARLFARLAAAAKSAPAIEVPSFATERSIVGDGKTLARETALARIGAAMMAHPEMVAGEGRIDTEAMRAAPGRLIAKGGAEGVQCFGVLEPATRTPGAPAPFGVAIKIEDGDGKRGGQAAAVEALHQSGVLDRLGLARLAAFHAQTTKSRRGIEVGEVKAEFQLTWMRG